MLSATLDINSKTSHILLILLKEQSSNLYQKVHRLDELRISDCQKFIKQEDED